MQTVPPIQRLSNQQARRLVLHLQGLTHPPHLKLGISGLHDLIVQLGFVQLDSIQWVERAQHMILYARNQTYRPSHLVRLLEKERLLFENWTHDASVIPSQFFCYWRHKFARDKPRLDAKFTNWQGPGYRDKCDNILNEITGNGPLRSRDVEREQTGPQEMWQWHDGKAALEFLWRTGELCISGREGFQKIYDLTSRGIHDEHFCWQVEHDEFVDWACRAALQRLGFGTASDIARFWDLLSIAEVRNWLQVQDRASVVEIEVEGITKGEIKRLYARPDICALLEDIPDLPARVRALSPFDPVIRDRKRLSWLFGFDYRIEIYVPQAKRVWGYYVFPLLEKDRLIGRIDMRANRKQDQLEVKQLWLEHRQKLGPVRKKRLDAELLRQARLGGVSSVVWL